jgi:hypothetical protein
LALDGERPASNKRQEDTVFISYAHEDEEIARKLYSDLMNAGLIPWLDKESIPAGERWEPEVRKAIRNSRYFIPLLSRHSVMKKRFVQSELKDALDILDEIRKSDIYIIPIRIDKIEITDRKLRQIHFVDMFSDWNRGVEKILKRIKSGAPPLSPAARYRMQAAEIGLGIFSIVLSIFIGYEIGYWQRMPTGGGLVTESEVTLVSIALFIIGIERIITGIFSPDKGRRVVLGVGILVLILSVTSMINLFYISLYLLEIALLVDGSARVYFGIANKTTSRRSRIFSIVAGSLEGILGITLMLMTYLTDATDFLRYQTTLSYNQYLLMEQFYPLLSLLVIVTVMTVGIQMMVAGIDGRRLTIAR